jgi:trans-2,3-dihydro-3-hydroxyanthranilate isomerase
MRVGFRLVDVFTERPLAGNQLCVIPEGAGLDPGLMQSLAREIGFSETTFVIEANDDRYDMRIFTPAKELPFAGHPSLGTAFVLASEGRIRTPATQSVAAGEYDVDVDVAGGMAWMRQGAATFGAEPEDLRALADAVGLIREELHPDLPPQVVSTGLEHLLVPARTEEAVKRARADATVLPALLESMGADALYLFCFDGSRAKARLLGAPIIGEDPATGSAAGPLGAYLVRREAAPPGRIVVSQGVEVGRPSTLLVDVGDDDQVSVGGGVRAVGGGEFDLP